MSKLNKKMQKKLFSPPGFISSIEEKIADKTKITLIDYREDTFEEKQVNNVGDCFTYKDKNSVTWINIDGLKDTAIIEKIGKHYEIHPLVLEDILNTTQRPKCEDFENYLFIVFKMLTYDDKSKEADYEQVSLILGSNYVVSFQEKPGDVFNSIRDRIRNAKGRVRKNGSDYLAYALIDAVIDNYFVVLEKYGERIEDVEDILIDNPSPKTLQAIHQLKKEMILLRKSVWPLREVISNILRNESLLIKNTTMAYLRDIYDHTIQIIDTIETFRDMVSGMMDIYLSSISNKMNEIMKTLTILASIFIPLTFIAGIYGMNFKYMPELDWPYGYAFIWLIFLLILIMMLYYFKRKKWI